MTRRVLAIGLDGFEVSIADRLAREGRMPNFAHLQASSARVDLDHGPAKRTGLAWEHFSTGLTPGGARRWSAVSFDPATYACVQKPTRLPPFTAALDEPVVVFDAPYFDLQRSPRTTGLVAWGAHDPGVPATARPAELAAQIGDRFGPYPAERWIYGFSWPSAARTREMGRDLIRAAHLRSEIALWLLGERFADWSLGIVVVSELHSAIEALWHGVDAAHPLHAVPSAHAARAGLEGVYEAVDQMLGQLMRRFPDCLLTAFSIHGMGPNDADVPAMALLPELLYRRAFGQGRLHHATADPVARMIETESPSWTRFVQDQWQPDPGARTRALASRLGRLWRRLSRDPSDVAEPPLSWMPAAWYAPHWPRMPAFALPAFYDGQIRLNVEGREAHGSIPPADYASHGRQLADYLRSVTVAPGGPSVVKDVVFPHLDDPMSVGETEADLVVVWEGSPMAFHTPDCGTLGPLPPRRPGGHTGGLGVSLWSGPDVVPGTYGTRSSFDLVPTLLECLGHRDVSSVDGHSFLGCMLAASSSFDPTHGDAAPGRGSSSNARGT